MTLLQPILIALLTALLATALLARGIRGLPLDHPNERSLHAVAMPRTGGLGVFLGVAAAVLSSDMASLQAPLWLAAVLAMGSLLDDFRGLGVLHRLSMHLAAALACLWLVAPAAWGGLEWSVATCAIVWMTNLYNFMDGADGLAGGMALFGFGTYGIAAWQGGDSQLAVAALSIAASATGFLVFNFHPARIFMGDSGSIPLGFLAASLGLIGFWRGHWPILFPIVVFAPFIIDATITLLRRMASGEKVWQAHRSHYYQRVVRMGGGHLPVALGAYVLMLASGGVAMAMLYQPDLAPWLLTVLGFIFVVLVLRIDQCWKHHEA